jgi:hypothetical protein
MDAYFDNESRTPYFLTPWQEIETRTALRLKVFRKEITPAEMRASLETFEEDISSGRWKHSNTAKQQCGDSPAAFPTVMLRR